MFIFHVDYHVSGYAGRGSSMFTIYTKDDKIAFKKLYLAMQKQHMLSPETSFDEFDSSFGEDWSSSIDGSNITSVHPNDAHIL